MKRLIKIVSLVLLFIGVSMGCRKFLDLDPPYTQDAENFFNNEDEYLRALTGAYDLLAGIYVSYWIGDIASDNCIAGGESVTDTEGLTVPPGLSIRPLTPSLLAPHEQIS